MGAFDRLLPFLQQQSQNRQFDMFNRFSDDTDESTGGASLEGILQNAVRARRVTPEPRTPPIVPTNTPTGVGGRAVPGAQINIGPDISKIQRPDPVFKPSPARPFPGIPRPQLEPEVYPNERKRYADPMDEYMYEHGVMHGEPEHQGFWNRLKHIGLGALANASGTAAAGGTLENILGGMLGGGIFGGVKPQSADTAWDQFIVEPEGQRQYKKKLIQEQIDFDRKKRNLELEDIRGSITGRQWQQSVQEMQARNQWDDNERQRQNQDYLRWKAEQEMGMSREQHEWQRQEQARRQNAPLAVSGAYYFDAQGVPHEAPGFDVRYGQGRGTRGPSPSAVHSALEKMDPIAKIVDDTFKGDPDAGFRSIAATLGDAKAEEVRITHEKYLGIRNRLEPPYFSDDAINKNEKLLQKHEAAARHTMEVNANKSRGLQIQWIRQFDPDWDPNSGVMPYYPPDEQIIRDLQNAGAGAPAGGGVTSDKMTFPPTEGVTPTPPSRDRTTEGRRKPVKDTAAKMDKLLGE